MRVASRQLRQSLDRLRARAAKLTRDPDERHKSPAEAGEQPAASPPNTLDLATVLLARVRRAREQARSLRQQAADLKKQAAEFRESSQMARTSAGRRP